MSTTSFRLLESPGCLTAGIYAVLAALALFITLEDPQRNPRRTLSVRLIRPLPAIRAFVTPQSDTPAEAMESAESDFSPHSEGEPQDAQEVDRVFSPYGQLETEQKHAGPEAPYAVEQVPLDDVARRDIPFLMVLPHVPLYRVVDREQEIADLDSLLQLHPEYRESIFREMIAGDPFIPDTVPHPRESIMYMLKRQYYPRYRVYGNVWQGGRAIGYDPVHGWDDALQKTGPQINLFALPDIIDGLLNPE